MPGLSHAKSQTKGTRRVSGHPSSRPDEDRDPGAGTAQHLNEAVHAEAIDLAADEVTDPRLSDPEQARGLRLGEPPGLDEPGQPDHEVGADLQMLRLLARESQVAKDVAGRPSDSDGHLFLLMALQSLGIRPSWTRLSW